MATRSNFECQNACIEDGQCKSAYRIYSQAGDDNCFLQYANNTNNGTVVSTEDTEFFVINGIYFIIKEKLSEINRIH